MTVLVLNNRQLQDQLFALVAKNICFVRFILFSPLINKVLVQQREIVLS